jgi:hypothetical protein
MAGSLGNCFAFIIGDRWSAGNVSMGLLMVNSLVNPVSDKGVTYGFGQLFQCIQAFFMAACSIPFGKFPSRWFFSHSLNGILAFSNNGGDFLRISRPVNVSHSAIPAVGRSICSVLGFNLLQSKLHTGDTP